MNPSVNKGQRERDRKDLQKAKADRRKQQRDERAHRPPMDFEPSQSFECDLRYPADSDLPDGWLFTPTNMDQKWAIAFRNGRVPLIRSWTGKVVASGKARFESGQIGFLNYS